MDQAKIELQKDLSEICQSYAVYWDKMAQGYSTIDILKTNIFKLIEQTLALEAKFEKIAKRFAMNMNIRKIHIIFINYILNNKILAL